MSLFSIHNKLPQVKAVKQNFAFIGEHTVLELPDIKHFTKKLLCTK